MAFGKAFKAARAAGKKEFSYKGKKYHTRTAEEEAGKGGGKPAKVPTPSSADKARGKGPQRSPSGPAKSKPAAASTTGNNKSVGVHPDRRNGGRNTPKRVGK